MRLLSEPLSAERSRQLAAIQPLVAQEGIEAAQETILAGKAGSRRVIRDRSGRVIEEDKDFQPAQPGQDVALTLDLRLQYFAYRALKAKYDPENALPDLYAKCVLRQ